MENWLNSNNLMKKAKEDIESIFKEKVNEKGSLNVTDALQIVTDFYNEYVIIDVDGNNPDNDMLLFEYGIYDWQDGKGENYTIDIVRQFYVENDQVEGFSQLHLMLYFNCEEYRHVEAANKWSIDVESIEEWKTFVVNSQGFKSAEGKMPKAFDVFLTEPD